MTLLPEWSSRPLPVIGMLHAPALPGSPGCNRDFTALRQLVLSDAQALVAGGVDGLMLENYGDSPFYPGRVPAVTVAAMTALACDVRMRFDIPLGINVLRNDGQSALAIAIACGASFIRVNVLCGSRISDQGMLNAIAHDLLRDRTNLAATGIQIWADVDVKHSAALASRPLNDEVHDLIERGKADAVIVTGSATGQPIELETLQTVRKAALQTPVIIGSGATPESIPFLAPFASGVIVGSSIKKDGHAGNSVELQRVERIVAVARTVTP